ncbi:MAG: hypothetical protein QOH32_2950 [Bradyrhizobium sp.]|jgi:hypothetical protein|nr:hypothetical protein [Bradyrhizobium sp.]
MKRLMRWPTAAGLTVLAWGANAQTVMPASDFGGPGPYAAIRAESRWPGYGPRLLAPREVSAIVRERGFAPFGTPQQRGIVYTISVIDRTGDDGTLVIDARSGRIIRFLPASRMGDRFNEQLDVDYGPIGPLPPVATNTRRAPRPPLPIPHVARRAAVPLPKPQPAPTQQSAQAPAVTAPVEARPPVQVQPTQDMPKVQGLE